MKYLSLPLFISLAGISCQDRLKESDPGHSRVDKPFHHNVEFYILERPHVGAISPVNWKSENPGTSLGTGDLDEATNRTINGYAMKTEYRGSDATKRLDFHSITIRRPESEPIVIEVAFDGSPKEIWRDGRYAAGIRPKMQSE